jgi:hypothetical protein
MKNQVAVWMLALSPKDCSDVMLSGNTHSYKQSLPQAEASTSRGLQQRLFPWAHSFGLNPNKPLFQA